MNDRAPILFAAVAGLLGAGGVTLAAVAAHKVQSPAIATAAQMLMVHATATLAITAVAERSGQRRAWLSAAALLSGGTLLFALALVAPTLAGLSLFPMAAPLGGSMQIAGWLAVALAAILELRSGPK